MISWIQNIIIKKFAASWLAKLVQKFDGLKLIFGALLIVAGEFLKTHPTYGPTVDIFIELIRPFATPIIDAGLVTVIIGATHKAEKFIVWAYTWIKTRKRPPE